MRIHGALVAVTISAMAAGAASAETVTYYYAGAPARISNFPADNRPLFMTGSMRIEGDVQSLANQTIRIGERSSCRPHQRAVIVFAARHPSGKRILQRVRWFGIVRRRPQYQLVSIENAPDVNPPLLFAVASNFGDRIRRALEGEDLDLVTAQSVLAAKGYREGTRAYGDLLNGSWAGADPSGDNNASAWSTVLEADTDGTWIRDDQVAYASLIEANTQLALADPPGSYYDIPPAPIPLAPAWTFMAIGLASAGAFAAANRKAR